MAETRREISITTAYTMAEIFKEKMKRHPTKAPIRNQKEIISARTRLNVTTYLYLRPNDNARSLSTLIAVDVKRETPQRTRDETTGIKKTYR